MYQKKGFKNFSNPIDRKNFFRPGGKMCKIFANSWNTVIKIGKIYVYAWWNVRRNI